MEFYNGYYRTFLQDFPRDGSAQKKKVRFEQGMSFGQGNGYSNQQYSEKNEKNAADQNKIFGDLMAALFRRRR